MRIRVLAVAIFCVGLTVALLIAPATQRVREVSQQHRERGPQLLSRFVQGATLRGTNVVLNIAPRQKRGFRISQSGRTGNEISWGIARQSVTRLNLAHGSTFQFASDHCNGSYYRYQVQQVEKGGVRLRVLDSATWFAPDKEVFIAWRATRKSP